MAAIEPAAWKAIWPLLLDPEELWRQGNAYNDRQESRPVGQQGAGDAEAAARPAGEHHQAGKGRANPV
jgi:hypothetical protein